MNYKSIRVNIRPKTKTISSLIRNYTIIEKKYSNSQINYIDKSKTKMMRLNNSNLNMKTRYLSCLDRLEWERVETLKIVMT
jgi:hypothetical protein